MQYLKVYKERWHGYTQSRGRVASSMYSYFEPNGQKWGDLIFLKWAWQWHNYTSLSNAIKAFATDHKKMIQDSKTNYISIHNIENETFHRHNIIDKCTTLNCVFLFNIKKIPYQLVFFFCWFFSFKSSRYCLYWQCSIK